MDAKKIAKVSVEDPRRESGLRECYRPTVTMRALDPHRMHEALVNVFRQYEMVSMDMDALIHFALRSFPGLTPVEFESMQRYARDYIIKHFAIFQGGPLRLADFSMYRLTVCHSEDQQKK